MELEYVWDREETKLRRCFSVWNFLKEINDPEGRVVVEYGNYNDLGSLEFFELTPYFAKKPVLRRLAT